MGLRNKKGLSIYNFNTTYAIRQIRQGNFERGGSNFISMMNYNEFYNFLVDVCDTKINQLNLKIFSSVREIIPQFLFLVLWLFA